MNNPYTFSCNELLTLYVTSQREFVSQILIAFSFRYSEEEIRSQVSLVSGEIVDEINARTESFARRTENVEFLMSIGLSDFYFGEEAETKISFEMRRGFNGEIKTYEDLIQNIESSTHIDCSISFENEVRHFQIKRYPQEYLKHTNEAFLNYLDQQIIPHYSNMVGTTLVVILQPNPSHTPKEFRFEELAEALHERAETITFDEVALAYSDATGGVENSFLHRLHPYYEISSIPTDRILRRFRGEI